MMATLRKDSFTARKPKSERGRTAPFAGLRPGISGQWFGPPFKAPLNDLYGRHVTFGEIQKEDKRKR